MDYVYEFMSLYRSLNHACDDTFTTRRFFFVARNFLGFFFWIHLWDSCLPSGQIDCYCLRSIGGFRLLVRC